MYEIALRRLLQKYTRSLTYIADENKPKARELLQVAEKAVEEYKKGGMWHSNTMEKKKQIRQAAQEAIEDVYSYLEYLDRLLLKKLTVEEIKIISFTITSCLMLSDNLCFKASDNTFAVDIFQHITDEEGNHQTINETRPLSPAEWKDLTASILNFLSPLQQSSCYNMNIIDGKQWGITIITIYEQEIEFHGSNDFPPNWSDIHGLFKSYFKPT